MPFDYREWNRQKRARFAAEHGFSLDKHYEFDKARDTVLDRDGRTCVRCGMTEIEHRQRWGWPLTIDHIDHNRQNNDPSNLQCLCCRCHGKKDGGQIPAQIPQFKETILASRKAGQTYRQIGKSLGFSMSNIRIWVLRWEAEDR
jgi:hypothetical protein